MPEQRPPKRTSSREQNERYRELHSAPTNGGEGGIRSIDPGRHTENAPSRRYRLIVASVALLFVAAVVYISVDAVVSGG